MKLLGRTALVAGLSVILHVLLGWGWTAMAAIAGGAVTKRYGWLVGFTGVAFGWAVIVIYSFVVAPHSTAEMTRIFSSLLGNLPAGVTVAATVSIGAAIGGLGGLLGQLLVSSFASRRHAAA